MNNILRYIVYISIISTVLITVGQEEHASVESSFFQKSHVDLFLPATTKSVQKEHGLPVYQQFCRYATNSNCT